MNASEKKNVYERKETYSLDAIFDNVPDDLPDDFDHHKSKRNTYFADYDGDRIAMASQRYQVFKNSARCVTCGIEGSFFAKERAGNSKRYHFNLYAVRPDGSEVLMTKDHIVPKSRGGKNTVSNYQTMCSPCNRKKGSSYVDDDILRAVAVAIQSTPSVWIAMMAEGKTMFCRHGHAHMGEPDRVVLETYFTEAIEDQIDELHLKCINRERAKSAIAAYEKALGKYPN